MKRVLCPDDSSAAPSRGPPSDDDMLDFRRWLAAVQSGLHTAPGTDDVRPAVGDRSPRAAGDSPDFPAHGSRPGHTR